VITRLQPSAETSLDDVDVAKNPRGGIQESPNFWRQMAAAQGNELHWQRLRLEILQ
jgi:hypothetical protein